MKKSFLLSALFTLLLAACGSNPAVQMASTPLKIDATPSPDTFTATPIPPTPTLTPTPTELPIPQGLKNVPEGYTAAHNPDGTWGYAKDDVSIPNLTVDITGAHFLLDGKSIYIPVSEIKNKIHVGQEGQLQIDGVCDRWGNIGIAFAWDAVHHTWIRNQDIHMPYRNEIPDYIKVQTRVQLDALFDLEPLVMSPFPLDTYFPPLDKVIVDYQKRRDQYSTADFSYLYPFGKVTDITKKPFRPVNFIILEKGEGRKSDTYILTEQVFNPKDKTFSLLHIGADKYGEKPGFLDMGLSLIYMDSDPSSMALPLYEVYTISPYPGYESCNNSACNQIDWFIKHNYFVVETGQLTETRRLVVEWLTTGKVPKPLERLVNLGMAFYIIPPKP
jgi:hypothetical protein